MDLIGAIHRRTGIDHIAQRRMVVTVHRLMPRQHGQDGRHSEHVADAMPLDELPGLLAVQPFAGQQDGDGAACHLAQRMDAGAMRQGCHHQRGVLFRRARHQIAEMVADNVFHLPMRQHAGLRSPRGARGIEEPRRIIAIDIDRTFDCHASGRQRLPRQLAITDRNMQPHTRVFRARRGRVLRKRHIEDMHRRARGLCEIRHFRRRQPEIRRHPHRAEHPRCEHRLQHRIRVPRVQQHPIAMPHAMRSERTGRALNPAGKLRPGPHALAPDDRRPLRKPPRRLQQQMCEVAGRDQRTRRVCMSPYAHRHGGAWPRHPRLCSHSGGKTWMAGLRLPRRFVCRSRISAPPPGSTRSSPPRRRPC